VQRLIDKLKLALGSSNGYWNAPQKLYQLK